MPSYLPNLACLQEPVIVKQQAVAEKERKAETVLRMPFIKWIF